jgi:hypothetical protein
MATPLTIGDTIEVRFYMTSGTQVAIVVRHYEPYSVIGNGGTDTELAATLGATFSTSWKNMIASVAKYEGLAVQVIKPLRQLAQVDKTGAGLGVNASDLLPPQTAGRLKILTDRAGKSFRGRVYVPFPAEGQSSPAGVPTGAYMTDLANLASSLLATRTAGAGANSTDVRPVVYSRKLQSRAIARSFIPSPFWGTMRRRSFIGSGDLLSI